MKTKWPKTGFEEFVKRAKDVEHTREEWEKLVYGEWKPKPKESVKVGTNGRIKAVCSSCKGGICINKCNFIFGNKADMLIIDDIEE